MYHVSHWLLTRRGNSAETLEPRPRALRQHVDHESNDVLPDRSAVSSSPLTTLQHGTHLDQSSKSTVDGHFPAPSLSLSHKPNFPETCFNNRDDSVMAMEVRDVRFRDVRDG